jgi:NAD(P)-dependent dehydrogenase (short-subunit alcohol dehydrogenase family)
VVEQLAYASSKGALHAAMFHLAKELGPRRIRVNTVVPTWMWGPPVQMYVQWQVADRGISEEEAVAEITRNMPLGEIPADEDVAESAVFLCSDRARMITGQTLYVNSGEYMT